MMGERKNKGGKRRRIDDRKLEVIKGIEGRSRGTKTRTRRKKRRRQTPPVATLSHLKNKHTSWLLYLPRRQYVAIDCKEKDKGGGEKEEEI